MGSLQTNTTYYCRVRAYAGSIVSPNSSSISVTTGQDQAPAPTGMALIPARNFTMGDTLGDGYSDELPLHTVYVSAFYLDQTEVTKVLWDEVYQWATNRPVGLRYGFAYGAAGKAANHPA